MNPSPPTLREATAVWLRVAALSFGGPAGQIAVMHRILVDEKRWIGEARFLHALNYCMLLPGPEAQQLATYVGWLLHGTRGGLVAGWLFVLPGFLSILALSLLYTSFGHLDPVAGLFFGLKAAVLAVVVEAVQRIGKRVLKNGAMVAVAVASFVGIFFFGLPFPLLVLGAGLVGAVGDRFRPDLFEVVKGHAAPGGGSGGGLLDHQLDGVAAARPSTRSTLRTAGTWLVLWGTPVVAIHLALGTDHVFSQLGRFFSAVATVTFGGAYSVLAYVAQQAVEHHGWLSAGEMLDGLGMAETTPGPLIQVVQFVGFLAAFREPGALSPLAAGVLGSVLTTWVTFAPCFLWIFTGAPYIEWLRGNRRLTAALSTITAAVVGVVLNLAIWFALHVAFGRVELWQGPLGFRLQLPDPATIDLPAVGIAALAFLATFRLHLGMIRTLLGAAVLGVAWTLLSG
ncbi:chromate efflux transporter [Myxococcota bacterium]|nr:chromate efflux transporter [Myxococcota bacterium]